jgi:hypothetical protein
MLHFSEGTEAQRREVPPQGYTTFRRARILQYICPWSKCTHFAMLILSLIYALNNFLFCCFDFFS